MKKILLLLLLTVQISVFAQIPDVVNCDNDQIFDLTSQEVLLIGTQNPTDVVITYHTTQSDAQNGLNAIVNSSNYTSISNSQTIYARIENIITSAITIENFNLIVNTYVIIDELFESYNCGYYGSINFTIIGGSGSYSSGLYVNYILVATQNGNNVSFTNLEPGAYSIIVTDALGCSTYNQAMIIDTIPVDFTFSYSNIYCSNDGAIYVTATGGSGIYYYSIDGVTFQDSSVFSNLPPGTYSVTVMDSNGCQNIANNIEITAIVPLAAYPTVSGNTLIINASGGTPPYSYSINGGVTQNFLPPFVITGLPPGLHCIEISDQHNCSIIDLEMCVTITGSLTLNANGTYTDYNNDGFVNVGDIINYDFTVTNTETLDVTAITLDAFGLTNNGNSIATLNGGASNTSTFAATYVLNQNDINVGSVSKNFQVNGIYDGNPVAALTTEITNLTISDGIKLNAFIDTNSNNIQDNGEININIGSFEYQLNNGNVISVVSSTGTHYLYETNASNSYNLSFVIDPAYAAQYSLSQNNYNNIIVTTNSGITTYNFPLTVIPYVDLQVYLNQAGTLPRPGFTYQNRILYRNDGNQTIASGVVTFTNSNAVTILSVSQSGITSNSNGFSYNFTNLLPHEEGYIYVIMQTPTIPTVALGDVLTNSVAITIPSEDVNIGNNEASLSQIIVGSYDPNDKTEIHGGKIVKTDFSTTDYLTYTIQFENTGTANAVNVKVDDILDGQLDASTIKMIDGSHPYVLERNGANLSWKFDGIDLPPSQANTTIGKGYVVFQIKPIAGYEIGDIIPNTANIYFDFNPAIVTNTFSTEFVTTLNTQNFKNNSFSVYPNPMNEEVFVTSKNNNLLIESLYLIDVLGKVIYKENTNNNTARLDVSNLQKGVYFLKIKTTESDETIKLIKQ